jgi:hypothetical protein
MKSPKLYDALELQIFMLAAGLLDPFDFAFDFLFAVSVLERRRSLVTTFVALILCGCMH